MTSFYLAIGYLLLGYLALIDAWAQITQSQDRFAVKNNQANSGFNNSKGYTALVSAQIAAATTITAANESLLLIIMGEYGVELEFNPRQTKVDRHLYLYQNLYK